MIMYNVSGADERMPQQKAGLFGIQQSEMRWLLLWKATWKRMKLDCCLSLHTKINLKWIKDLNRRPETIKCIEENIETKLMNLELKESPEVNPCLYGQIIFNKGDKNIQRRKERLFNKWCWENWKATCKRMKLDCCLSPHTKFKMD